ncbi:S-methyl-5-thioribose-1-phosphate isomerase, partial [Streptomyces sp. Adlamb9]
MADHQARSGGDERPSGIPAIRWEEPPEGPVLVLLDQTRLPAEEVELVCTDASALVEAIRSLAVRGAPLLGIAGAYGVALAAARGFDVSEAARSIEEARPTAVNLSVGVRRARAAHEAELA